MVRMNSKCFLKVSRIENFARSFKAIRKLDRTIIFLYYK